MAVAREVDTSAGTRTVRAGDTDVNVLVAGRGKQTVLLMHGFGDSINTWQRVIPSLAQRNRILALDLPGFGDSGPVMERPLIEGYARTVAELLRLLAPGVRVTLIGNSLGGAVALQLALDSPELVQRLVLVDCAGLGRGVPLWWRLVTLNVQPARVALTGLRVVPPRLVEGVAGIIYERLAFRHPGRVDGRIIRGFARHYQSLRDVDDVLNIGHDMVRELMSAELLQRAAGLDVPTLVLWGRNDRLVPVSHGETLAHVLKRGTLSVVEDCGHCPQLERPEMFLEAVAPFLAEGASAVVRPAASDASGAS